LLSITSSKNALQSFTRFFLGYEAIVNKFRGKKPVGKETQYAYQPNEHYTHRHDELDQAEAL